MARDGRARLQRARQWGLVAQLRSQPHLFVTVCGPAAGPKHYSACAAARGSLNGEGRHVADVLEACEGCAEALVADQVAFSTSTINLIAAHETLYQASRKDVAALAPRTRRIVLKKLIAASKVADTHPTYFSAEEVDDLHRLTQEFRTFGASAVDCAAFGEYRARLTKKGRTLDDRPVLMEVPVNTPHWVKGAALEVCELFSVTDTSTTPTHRGLHVPAYAVPFLTWALAATGMVDPTDIQVENCPDRRLAGLAIELRRQGVADLREALAAASDALV